MPIEFATHYFLPDRSPFLNLSEADEDTRSAVEREMAELRATGRQLRPFGRRYMQWRKLTEERLFQLFVARGGRPVRTVPHYFVLGESPWFEHLAVGMRSVRVPLKSLQLETTSVTMTDSFTAMQFGERFGFPTVPQPHHGRVFLLNEIDNLVAEFGMPAPEWREDHDSWQKWPASAYIEIQLWSDEPIRDHLGRGDHER